jgi:adenine-specific DNA-methyltransferase
MQTKLSQYFTPMWAAELLLQRHFPNLAAGDVLTDPTCGDGRFLMAVPQDIDAFGVELDPTAAELARANTGRTVIDGHFKQVMLPAKPTAVIGNPPFVTRLIDDLMDCCYEWMEYGGKVGLILPCYYFQRSARVVDLSKRWSLGQEMLPRDLFEGLKHPIMFATFVKERQTVVAGFFLHHERDALEDMRAEFRRLFVGNGARAGMWKETVYAALRACGGEATLQQLYTSIEKSRPTRNPWWKEKVRQVAGQYFTRIRDGLYSIPDELKATA